jgi:predicted nucleotidyltransferase
MAEKKLKRILDELQKGLSQILGAQLVNVFLYGSQARGDARNEAIPDECTP